MRSFGNIAVLASSIRRSQLKEIFQRRYKKARQVPLGIDQPDYLCFLAYAMLTLTQVWNKWPEAEKPNFVASKKRDVTHHVGEFKEELQKILDPPLNGLVGELIPASLENLLPLQSADVLLWHIQRYYAAGRDQYRMKPVDRMRAAQLIHDGNMDGTVYAWEKPDLERTAQKWAGSGVIPSSESWHADSIKL